MHNLAGILLKNGGPNAGTVIDGKTLYVGNQVFSLGT